MDKVAVVIPAFNESSTIRDVAARARVHCEIVIVVDDGSASPLAPILADLDVALIRHKLNQGKAAAICTGAEAALQKGATAIVTLDGDGQHQPEDLPAIIALGREHPNSIIIGVRTGDQSQRPAARYRANQIADFWISWAAGYTIRDSQSGFRLYPAAVFNELDLRTSKRHGFVFESEILIEAANQGIGSQSLEIADLAAEAARPSHFRPVADITSITLMVAGRLIRRGLYLPGLYRSYCRPKLKAFVSPGLDSDALFALVLSLLFMLPTLGLFYLWFLFRVIRAAVIAPVDYPDAGAVIILGHQLDDGNLSAEFTARLQRALQMYNSDNSVYLYVAGGLSGGSITEAEAGYRYLTRAGVDPARVRREDVSTHTVENLAHIKAMLTPFDEVALVTSRYHLERTMTVATGMGMRLRPCGAETKYSFVANFPKALVEAFFIHWYWAGRVFGTLTRNDRILGKLGLVR